MAKKTKKVSKKTVSKKATKKVSKKVKEAPMKPYKKKLTNTELIVKLAEQTEVDPKIVKKVLISFSRLMQRSIMPGGLGEFQLTGFFKVMTTKVKAKKMAAIKKGTEVRNPATGEMMPSKGRKAFTKPATVRVKVRVLGKLKKAGKGEL